MKSCNISTERNNKTLINYWYLWIIIIVFMLIIIPVLLNFLLLIPSFTSVIQNDTSSALWLTFLGSYFSAIGTFVMAFFTWKTICQSRQIHKEDSDYQNYDILEKRIIRYEKIQHFDQLKHIVNVYLSDGYASAYKLLLDLLLNLQSVGNELVRINNHQDEQYNEYGKVLSELNKRFYILMVILQQRIEWHENIIDLCCNDEYIDYINYLSKNNISFSQNEKEEDLHTFVIFAKQYYDTPLKSTSPYNQLASLGQGLLMDKMKSFMDSKV